MADVKVLKNDKTNTKSLSTILFLENLESGIFDNWEIVRAEHFEMFEFVCFLLSIYSLGNLFFHCTKHFERLEHVSKLLKF